MMLWIQQALSSVAPFLLIGAIILFLAGARAVAASLAGLSALVLFVMPITMGTKAALPGWVGWLLMVVVALWGLRWVMRLLIGKEASDQMVGGLAGDLVTTSVRGFGRVLRWPFRRRRPISHGAGDSEASNDPR
jgi:hypothetical protein